eukprot:COSAG05_NODE_4325_length_1567_cov_1.333106_5_plen_60_part_01
MCSKSTKRGRTQHYLAQRGVALGGRQLRHDKPNQRQRLVLVQLTCAIAIRKKTHTHTFAF